MSLLPKARDLSRRLPLSLRICVLTALFHSVALAVPPDRRATVTWDEVTLNADGSPVTQPVAYRTYCGLATKTYTFTSLPAPTVNRTYDLATVPLADGRWYCAVTASTADGESNYSNELVIDINRKYPGAPKNLRLN